MSTTFNTLNDISKKQRMLFLADSMGSLFSPIAYATSANLSFSADDVDVSNKMDGGWATSMQGKKSAEVSVDALCAYKTGLTSETALQTGWSSDKLYAFLYIMCEVVENNDGSTKLKYDSSVPYYYGYMKLASLDLTSDNGDVAKFSVSGKSQGNVTQMEEYSQLLIVSSSCTSTEAILKPLYVSGSYVGEQFVNANPTGSEGGLEITSDTSVASDFSYEVDDDGNIVVDIPTGFTLGEKFTIDYNVYSTKAEWVYTGPTE